MACGVAALMGLLPTAHAQLNENCVVSVLNRNVQAKADGTWVLPNIPANFGQLRARATCVQGGVTSYGESAPFALTPNGSVTLPPIALGATTPIPTRLTVTAPSTTLTTLGATVQLSAQATYPAPTPAADVTASANTTYLVSNPDIATISPTGLVTAVRSGTVVVQARNEGTTGIVMVRVVLSGVDSDGDGIPDDVEIRLGMNPNNPADALLDVDHDGLNALEEYRLGTDPNNPDTDGDGISDGDEVRGVRGYVTNPLLADTDGDGIRDGLEIATGSDPTDPNSYNLAAALASIRVTPGAFTLIVNSLTGQASVQLTVIGTLIDGNEINLTSTGRQTRYASSNVQSCNFGSPDGRVFGSTAGTCQITVSNNGHTAVVSGTVQDFVPTQLSFVAIPGYANGVAIGGDFAYVAAGSSGLQVVALSADRRNPTVVAGLNLGATAYAVTLAGNIAYLGTSAGLKVVDVSVPSAPRLLGSFATAGNAMGVRVRGTVAYIAAGSSLQIVSVANPGAMIGVSTLNLGGTAWNVELDPTRNLAALAMGGSGLKLVDVSNLQQPVLRGTAAISDVRGMALMGNTAIVADYNNSMTSVDIGNLASPRVLSATPLSLGGRLNNVVLSGNFGLGADVLFVNGVPIVDVTNPAALAPRAILNFTARDDNGMDIAVDNSYIYLVADNGGLNRGGSSGNSRLYIGQYQPRADLAGVPPSVSITAPAPGNVVYEGAPLTVTVDAVDDVAVAQVQFLIGPDVVFTSSSAPYQYTFTVPTGVNSLQLGARAFDLGSNAASAAPVTITVAPDPLTQVVGQVITTQGTPVAGAVVTAPGGRSATTDADGRFSIVGVPTVLGNLVLQAVYTPADGITRTGSSNATAPVVGGVTDVGQLTVIEALFETRYGSFWTTCDDCSTQRTLPFAFPFYGQSYTQAFVGTNGYITFNSGDSTYTESVAAFTSLKRISLYFDDLIGGGGVWINDTLPDRFIVTYDRVQQYCCFGSRTMQMQLFRDGRILFAYKGISPTNTGNIVGLTPGPNTPFVQVDYSQTPTIDVPAGSSVYEYFTGNSPFDLDNMFLLFAPKPDGGYTVRTILAPVPAPGSTITGGAPQVVATQAATGPTALRQAQRTAAAAATDAAASGNPLTAAEIANAEVVVTSSSQPGWRAMTNTDAAGRFMLAGVPAGGIDVTVRKGGRVIARGAAVFPGGNLSAAQLLDITLVRPEIPAKGAPGGAAVQ